MLSTCNPAIPWRFRYSPWSRSGPVSRRGAVKLVEKAIRLDPYNSRGPYWNILGVVQFYEGNYQEAIAAFEENIRHDGPRAPGFYHYYAASLAAGGQTDNARLFLEQNYPRSSLDLEWQTWVYRNFQDKSGFNQLMSWLEPLGVQRTDKIVENQVTSTSDFSKISARGISRKFYKGASGVALSLALPCGTTTQHPLQISWIRLMGLPESLAVHF